MLTRRGVSFPLISVAIVDRRPEKTYQQLCAQCFLVSWIKAGRKESDRLCTGTTEKNGPRRTCESARLRELCSYITTYCDGSRRGLQKDGGAAIAHVDQIQDSEAVTRRGQSSGLTKNMFMSGNSNWSWLTFDSEAMKIGVSSRSRGCAPKMWDDEATDLLRRPEPRLGPLRIDCDDQRSRKNWVKPRPKTLTIHEHTQCSGEVSD